MKLIEKLFCTNTYFTIAIGNNDGDSFQPRTIMKATKDRWFADPMLAEDNGRTFLFYEATEGMHGHIEVVEVLPDCSIGKPTVIICGISHYSYPFVFKYQEQWFMIPETSELNEVCLYKAVNFPFQWEKDTVLSRAQAVDSTVFQFQNSWYMLTYIINGQNEMVEPRAYEIDLQKKVLMHESRWIDYDGLKTRGAGSVYIRGEKVFRPAQINDTNSYGDGIVIYEIINCNGDYREKYVSSLKLPPIKVRGKLVNGMHTYNSTSNFQVYDIRIRDLDVLKLPKKLIKN